MILGLVLAGGRSSRFGSEKAMIPLGDGVMIDRPLRVLAEVSAHVAVSVRPESGASGHAAALGLTALHDEPSDAEGPLAGIRRGLVWANAQGADWLAVAPCDAPTLTSAHYRRLLDALADRAVVARSGSGLEPLVSVWPITALAAIEAAVAAGAHPPIHALLTALEAVEVMLPDYDGVNVNRPADLAS